jgi:methylphosphotriester-DNA--protein-cysteine methyltransferase
MRLDASRKPIRYRLGAPSSTSPSARTRARAPSRGCWARTGTTPLRWLLDQRVRRAQTLLETTDDDIELSSQARSG